MEAKIIELFFLTNSDKLQFWHILPLGLRKNRETMIELNKQCDYIARTKNA